MGKLEYCVSLHRGQMHGPLVFSTGNSAKLLNTHFLTRYNPGKQKPCSTALDGVKESLDLIGTAIHELASKHKFCQLHLDACA